MNRYALILLMLLLPLQQALPQSVGLVLAGGGAKGIAHIGMIAALEENNIPIDYITGTSIGAIVGALYAMGYTPEEMVEIVKSDNFDSWQSGEVDKEFVYYFKKPDPTPEMASFKISLQDSAAITSQLLPTSLINPTPMNFAFMQLFDSYTAQSKGNFNNLFVPFRAVASDVYNKRAMVLGKGSLGDAVRASMSFPFLFKPIEIEGVLVYDGGIYDNFPVDAMQKEFAPDVIIGSNVSSNPKKPEQGDLVTQIENMIMQKTDYSIDPNHGVLLAYDLERFNLMDFDKLEEIYKIGYDSTMLHMAEIKERVPRQVTPESRAQSRMAFRAQTPELIFDRVVVSGGNEKQHSYLIKQFQPSLEDTIFSLKQAEERYYKVLSDARISDLIPHAIYNEENALFTLNLKARMDNSLNVGLGGFITSGNNNQIYLSGLYQGIGRHSYDLGVNGYFGQSYNSALFSSRIEIPHRVPLYLKMLAVYSNTKFYESETLFYRDELPSFIKKEEAYVKFQMGLPFMSSAKTEIALGSGYLRDEYYPTNTVNYGTTQPDRSSYYLLMGSLKFEANTLDAPIYPSSGKLTRVVGEAVLGNERYTPAPAQHGFDSPEEWDTHSWLQLTLNGQYYYELTSQFTLGWQWQSVLSSKGFFNNYTSTVIQAPAFTPTPHSKMVFNESLRANQYVAIGAMPIWKITSRLHLRTEAYLFAPLYRIVRGKENKPYYGDFLGSLSYMGEMSLVYNLPFASLSLFANHYNYPSGNWNFGVNLGIPLYNPKFLK